jgi:hypothetical protein
VNRERGISLILQTLSKWVPSQYQGERKSMEALKETSLMKPPFFFWTLSREASPVVFLLYLHDAAAVL